MSRNAAKRSDTGASESGNTDTANGDDEMEYKVTIESSDPSMKQFNDKIFYSRQDAIDYLWQLGFVPTNYRYAGYEKTKTEIVMAKYSKPTANEGEFIVDYGAPDCYAYIYTDC